MMPSCAKSQMTGIFICFITFYTYFIQLQLIFQIELIQWGYNQQFFWTIYVRYGKTTIEHFCRSVIFERYFDHDEIIPPITTAKALEKFCLEECCPILCEYSSI